MKMHRTFFLANSHFVTYLIKDFLEKLHEAVEEIIKNA